MRAQHVIVGAQGSARSRGHTLLPDAEMNETREPSGCEEIPDPLFECAYARHDPEELNLGIRRDHGSLQLFGEMMWMD
jgi:hypothetical protein